MRYADTLSPRQSVANNNDSMMFTVRQVVKSRRLGLRQRGSGTDTGQRCPNCGGSCPHSIGDGRPTGTPPHGQQAVVQRRMRLRRLPRPQVIAVFVQRHVTHVM